jgi:hypothetical protein
MLVLPPIRLSRRRVEAFVDDSLVSVEDEATDEMDCVAKDSGRNLNHADECGCEMNVSPFQATITSD